MTGTLILVRHGESEWNKLNLFTGWKNPDLTEKGIAEAKLAGQRLNAHGLIPDYCFTSALSAVDWPMTSTTLPLLTLLTR